MGMLLENLLELRVTKQSHGEKFVTGAFYYGIFPQISFRQRHIQMNNKLSKASTVM